MSVEENKAIARRFVNDGINAADLAVFDELLVPDVIDHYAPPGVPPGREGWKQTHLIFLSGFPDGHWVEEDLMAEDDKVVGRYTFHGTHQGEFFGIPATGKQVTVPNIHIMRLVAGKIVEHWGNGDDLGLLQQLGAVPTPAQ